MLARPDQEPLPEALLHGFRSFLWSRRKEMGPGRNGAGPRGSAIILSYRFMKCRALGSAVMTLHLSRSV